MSNSFECGLCGGPAYGKSWCSTACRNKAHINRRRLGGFMVAAGIISDRQIAAFIETTEAVSGIAADPEENAARKPCTAHTEAGEAIDMRGAFR